MSRRSPASDGGALLACGVAAALAGGADAEPRVRAGAAQVRAVLARRPGGDHDLRGRRPQGRARQVSTHRVTMLYYLCTFSFLG